MDIQWPTVLEPVEQVEDVVISEDHPQKILKIGTRLEPCHRAELIAFLRARLTIFAWSVHDLVGINPQVITHHLAVDPACTPVLQKRRAIAPERNQIVNNEVDRLLSASHIRPILYPI